jgi:hypothetical protein
MRTFEIIIYFIGVLCWGISLIADSYSGRTIWCIVDSLGLFFMVYCLIRETKREIEL